MMVALVVIGLPLLMYLAQDGLIFHPQPLTESQRSAVLKNTSAQSIFIDADNARLHAWHIPGDPLVIYFGGNAEDVLYTAGLASHLDAKRTLVMNYRGYGGSTGRPGQQSLYADALAIYDYVIAQGEQPRHVVLMGRSLGSGMATMLADGMRAVDILAALPDVDPERIGAIGHSLGAKEVLYLMAFDDRVKAGVSSEGGISLPSTNWDAPWYLGPAAKKSDFPRDHHELLAIIAPRPLLVLGGETGRGAADGNRSWPHIAAAQKVYRLYGEPVRLGLLNHGEGHKFSPASGEKSFAWLEAGLK